MQGRGGRAKEVPRKRTTAVMVNASIQAGSTMAAKAWGFKLIAAFSRSLRIVWCNIAVQQHNYKLQYHDALASGIETGGET